MDWAVVDRLVSGTLFIWSMGHYSSSFNVPELIALTLAMTYIGHGQINPPLFYASFYIFIFNDTASLLQAATLPLVFGYQVEDTWTLLREFMSGQPRHLFYLFFIAFACLLLQALAYNFAGRNMRRKIFHFASFCVFLNAPPAVFLIAQHLIYIFLALLKTGIPDAIFAPFASSKDLGRGIFSHLLLLGALTYPRFYLKPCEYTKLLITVCLMDSFASITGKYFASRKKSCWGFLGGQLAACITEYLVLGALDIKYHWTMGFAECCIGMNDNILLPILSVGYFQRSFPRQRGDLRTYLACSQAEAL